MGQWRNPLHSGNDHFAFKPDFVSLLAIFLNIATSNCMHYYKISPGMGILDLQL